MQSTSAGPNQPVRVNQQSGLITDQELLVYPMWGRLIEPESKAELATVRQRLQTTLASLERVQRQGSPEESRKAGIAAAAYQTVLALLVEIEQELA